MHQAPLAIFGTGLLGIFLFAAEADKPDSGHGSDLLADAGTQALRLKEDALMVAYAAKRSNVNWAGRVEQLRQHAEEANRELARLGEERASVSPGRRATIDRIRPLLQELVRNSEAVIRCAEQGSAWLHEHQAEVAARAELSSALASRITSSMKYGAARQRLDSIEGEPDPPRH